MKAFAPAWVHNAVFYQIFPDRFAKSSSLPKPKGLEPWDSAPNLQGFKGGDLYVIRERLDYLQDVGVTALYLNPIFQSTANHRYHTFDYFQVDPILGGNAALRRLVDELHRRSMHIVLDGVFNHASRGLYQFNHTLENGVYSPYLEWFHFNHAWLQSGTPLNAYQGGSDKDAGHLRKGSFEQHGYHAWWDIPALPKFNTAHPEVRAFLFRVAEHWVEYGIDGWRLDVPNEIDDNEFWQEFRYRVKSRNRDSYIVGEIWGDATRWLQGDQFDAVMNYLFSKATIGFFFGESLNYEQLKLSGYNDIQAITAEAYAAILQDLTGRYPAALVNGQLNLLGSHDTPRILNCGSGDEAGVKMAFLCMFTFPGAPCIYYGDEVGMAGNHDPDCRRSFDWDELSWNHDIFSYLKDCVKARRQCAALRDGSFKVLKAEQGILVFQRQNASQQVLVVFNTNQDKQVITFEIPELRPKNAVFKSIFSRGTKEFLVKNGVFHGAVEGREGELLVRHF